MLITASVIELNENGLPEMKKYMANMPGVELRGVSEDKRKLLILIESEDSDGLEKISDELKKHPAVFSVLYHSFHFDEQE